ncbi:cell surface glycoprotein 1-like isoform X2 [Dreissena polymorpha]|uniref:cell surface glycoprotein 1-like isoform X2 n=3 Tax=Dreissena polymorpha TaxID=45954 RepID=UPI00226431A6|nr:cell surface glycoprotein 1-like isoform X2 [Dreissena polymorpha]XP_052247968.1 cell surface glycoprotein 1-like isoform X3 [Dreissena polymorpha]XP_052284650.1 cell surface glycoprotein 1-like isoform X2 [Dreissena polymorpha]
MILDMTHGELKLLAKHLGHDVKTHKEYYQLSSSTMELSKVALMLYAVENGKVNEWKGRQMKDIVVEDLPLPIEDEDGHQEESMSTADSEEPGSLTHDRREPSEEPASLTHDRREPSEEPASLTHESMSTADSEEPGSVTHDRREPSEEPASLSHDRREPNPQESMSTADSEEPGSLTHDRREPSEEPASLSHDRRKPSEEPASLTHESMSTADSEEPGSLTHDRREPSEEPASLTHDRREPSEEPASLTHESMSTAASEGPASLTHDEMRQPNPQGTGTRKGMKRKWASEENICFMNFFRDELREKKMPSGSKIMGSLKILTGRTVAQIRARVHNIIMEKQKWKKNC